MKLNLKSRLSANKGYHSILTAACSSMGTSQPFVLSPPSGSNRSYTLVTNSWPHLNSASHPVITSHTPLCSVCAVRHSQKPYK